MPMEKATAVVLRVVAWSESSYVVTLFTREAGKVRAVAKGARKPKGPFESALDVLAMCKVVFLRKSSEALDVLTEAKLLRRFRPRGPELAGLYAGYYVAELLGELTDDYDPHPELFDAAGRTLEDLSQNSDVEPNVAQAVLRFELAALRLLGFLPSLTQCAECGLDVDSAGRVAFSQLAGGVLCQQCRGGKRQIVSLSHDAWQALVTLADPGEESRWTLARNTGGELRAVMNHYICGLIGRKPRMQDYLIGGRST